jgi:spore germination cell wall hydrolase CwlJ-like protein
MISLPDPRKLFRQHTALQLLAMLIWGEARGESKEGKIAVAWTVKNRVLARKWWGKTWANVILGRWQYSCFWEKVPSKMLRSPLKHDTQAVWDDCVGVAEGVYDGTIPDPSDGATHYYEIHMKVAPDWAERLEYKEQIGNHKFYKEA